MHIHRVRGVVLRVGSRMALAVCTVLPVSAGSPPDVVVVVLDDVGVEELAVYGRGAFCSGSTETACELDADCSAGENCRSDYARTPTIDALASEGLLFRNAWSMPGCRATRATLLTGRYGFRTGVLGNDGPLLLPYSERTVAEVIRDAPGDDPRATAAVGKWHLGGGAPGPNDHGFDHFAGALSNLGEGGYFSWSRTVDGATDLCAERTPNCPGSPYATSVQASDAIAWIEARTGPAFLYLAFSAPHSPMHVPPHILLSAETIETLPRDAHGAPRPPGYGCTGDEKRSCYLAMIEAADSSIARVLEALAGPTTVILLGDNGTPKAVTPPPYLPSQAKATLYQGGVHVPLIVRHADGLGAGTETAALVHTVDVFSTVLDLVGVAPPDDRPIDGQSLVPLLTEPAGSVRPVGYTERFADKAAHDGRHKLIHRPPYEELYDLETDPRERADLLAGACSSSASSCHVDADCPRPEICIPPVVDPAAALARDAMFSWMEAYVDHPAGEVPDRQTLLRDPLRIAKQGTDLLLDWDPSCLETDLDYAVYEGSFGDRSGGSAIACTTDGLTSRLFAPAGHDAFYLVVPHTGWREGAYGRASDGTPRPAASSACFPQQVAAVCD